MKRLILVINPRSSGFEMVQSKILKYLEALDSKKIKIITFEIQPTNPISNANEMAKILRDDDIILVAGGDGTAHITTNACVISSRKNLKIKYTGFGNFNDYAHSFSKNSGKAAVKSILNGEAKWKLRPLKISINGEFFRYAPLYFTVGLTAEMAEIFEGKKLREKLKKSKRKISRLILSLSAATHFYFRFRKKHILGNFSAIVDGRKNEKHPDIITDLVFMNGPRMARIMRSKINLKDSEKFGFAAINSGVFWANIPFLMKGFFGHVPLKRVTNADFFFEKPSNITLQIEGEVCRIKNVETLTAEIVEDAIEIL